MRHLPRRLLPLKALTQAVLSGWFKSVNGHWLVCSCHTKVNTPYDIRFHTDKGNEVVCSKELTAKELQRFRKAVKRDFYFQVDVASCNGLGFAAV